MESPLTRRDPPASIHSESINSVPQARLCERIAGVGQSMKKIFGFVACASFLCSVAGAQTASPAPAPSPAPVATEAPPATAAPPQTVASTATAGPATPAATPPAKTIEVPAGTKVLLALHSGVN